MDYANKAQNSPINKVRKIEKKNKYVIPVPVGQGKRINCSKYCIIRLAVFLTYLYYYIICMHSSVILVQSQIENEPKNSDAFTFKMSV